MRGKQKKTFFLKNLITSSIAVISTISEHTFEALETQAGSQSQALEFFRSKYGPTFV